VALGAAKLLQADRVRVRVVSMPSWELFAAQPPAYRTRCCRQACACAQHRGGVPVPDGSRWVTTDGAMLAMEGFGASAPGERLFEEFKFHGRSGGGDSAPAARATARPDPQ